MNLSMALAMVFLASLFNAGADNNPRHNPPPTPSHYSGISGQVFLIELSNLPGFPEPTDAIGFQTTFTVWRQVGNRAIKIGTYETAADGSFDVSLPPGIYSIEMPWSSYLYALPNEIVVQPGQITSLEIDAVYEFDDYGGVIETMLTPPPYGE